MSAKTSSAAKAAITRETRRQERLAERRRRIRRIERIVLSVLAAAAVGGALWVLWLPAVRVADIEITGTDASQAGAIRIQTEQMLDGVRAGIVPRDSIFFFPSHAIQEKVLALYPDVAEVEVARISFDAIRITAFPRIAMYRWCGFTPETPEECYVADKDGLIFAKERESEKEFMVSWYMPLTGSITEEMPLRAQMPHASQLRVVEEFATSFSARGLIIDRIALADDEAAFYIAGTDTRILYVLGEELAAAALMDAAYGNLPEDISTLEYIDLRFVGRAFFKKK